MSGHEVQGALLLCAIVLGSSFGKSHYSQEKMLGSTRHQAWTGLFDILMCFEELGKRKVSLNRNEVKKLDETIKLPQKGKLVAFDFDENMGDDITSFKGNISLEGNSLTVSEKVVLGKRVYEAEDWEMFRKVVQNQQKFAETPLIIELNY